MNTLLELFQNQTLGGNFVPICNLLLQRLKVLRKLSQYRTDLRKVDIFFSYMKSFVKFQRKKERDRFLTVDKLLDFF